MSADPPAPGNNAQCMSAVACLRQDGRKTAAARAQKAAAATAADIACDCVSAHAYSP